MTHLWVWPDTPTILLYLLNVSGDIMGVYDHAQRCAIPQIDQHLSLIILVYGMSLGMVRHTHNIVRQKSAPNHCHWGIKEHALLLLLQ